MSIKATLSSDGLEEVYTPPTLKDMCLYKCLTNREILTKEVEVDEEMDGSEKLDWEKFRLKEPLQRDLLEALLDAGEKYLFMLTPKSEHVFAAIRMSQPEHLVKVHVNNIDALEDRQLELLISGGNVKSLDIHDCESLRSGSLPAINKFGSKLEFLRIGNSSRILPDPSNWVEDSAILRTPNLKTFIVSEIYCEPADATHFWRFLLQDFINNLVDLQISRIHEFETLEFLEPAMSKLSALTLTNCEVADNPNAWASLFKLDNLRFLDVVGSSIEEALVGENVVERLLTAMPNLTHLAVDPGLVKDISVHTPVRGQGSVAKRLQFLGMMEDDVVELRKAKLLANEVAHFGTVEGEFCILEFYSNRLNSGYFDPTLEELFEIFNGVAHIPPYETVTVFSLLMKTIKNNGVSAVKPKLFIEMLFQFVISGMSVKFGEVLLDQSINAISAFLRTSFVGEDAMAEPEMINDVVVIIMNLNGQLCLDHYVTIVPIVMRMAETAMTKSVWESMDMEDFKNLLKNIAQLLKIAGDRFPGETEALWGISSVLVVIKELKEVVVAAKLDQFHLMEILCGMIFSLRNLCLNSGPRRAAFHSAEGVDIAMELLTEIIDGCLGLADPESFALLEILKSILQDSKLNLSSESGMIASHLEKLLLSLHSKWEFWKSTPVTETTHYSQFESIASLLSILENDPRYDYQTSDDVKEIMLKLE